MLLPSPSIHRTNDRSNGRGRTNERTNDHDAALLRYRIHKSIQRIATTNKSLLLTLSNQTFPIGE